MLVKTSQSKQNTQPNNHTWLEEYRQYLAKSLTEHPELCKNIFFLLITHIPIQEIQKSPHFLALRDKVCPITSPQEAFNRAAAFLARTNNLPNLKYLIETCRFDFSETKSDQHDTLLHFACARNYKEIFLYLLQKGFDVNAKTLNGKRPIHDLVLLDENAPLVQTFKKYGADLNALSSDKMTPLHIAAVRGNDKVILALKQEKVDHKKQFNRQNYLQLKEAARKGSISLTLAVFNDKADPAEENTALFYKALFSDKFHQNAFRAYVEFFKNKILSLTDQGLFFYAYFFSTAITAQNIKQFSASYVETGKITKNIFLQGLQTMTQCFVVKTVLYTHIIDELNDIQLALLERMDIQLSMVSNAYLNISHWYNLIQLSKKAEHTATRGLQRLPEEAVNQIKRSHIYYNLATSQQALLNITESLENFGKAFELNNSDNDIFLSYFRLLMEIEDYEKAKAICSLSACHEHSKLLMLMAQHQASELNSFEALKELECFVCEEPLTTSLLDFQFICYLRLGNSEEAFSVAKKSFSSSEKSYESKKGNLISTALEKFLRACLCTKKYQEGFDFLKLCQLKYPLEYTRNNSLKTALFIFYLRTEQLEAAEQLIKDLSQSKIDPEILCDLWTNLALHQEDPSRILHYLEIALTNSPDSLKANFYKKLILLLPENEYPSETDNTLETLSKQVAEIANPPAIDVVVQNNMETSVPAEEASDSTEIEFENPDDKDSWTHKKRHIFFQEQKNKALLALQNSISKTPQPKGVWKIGETTYRERDPNLFPLNSPLYPDHYVAIDRNLLVDKKYHQALKKGLCNRASNQDGLKVLCNTLAELKLVGENTRLYTVKVYQNGNKYLFVLDKTGNHLKIKRELNLRNHLEIIDASSVSENCQPSELSNHGDNKPQKSLSHAHGNSTQPLYESTGADIFSRPVFSSPPDESPKNDFATKKVLEINSTP